MATALGDIHTKDDHLFLNSNVIAIGWKEFGDLKAVEPSREAFKEHYESVYENAKKGSIGTGEVTWIDKAGKHIRVEFSAGEKTFIFPEAFKQGFLKPKED